MAALLFMCIALATCEEEKPKMIVLVTAEGISTVPNNQNVNFNNITNGIEGWLKVGFNTLTNNGKRQMYNLGRFIQDDYPEIFEGLNPKEMKFYGSDKVSSISSVISLISAFHFKKKKLPLENSNDHRLVNFLTDNSPEAETVLGTVTTSESLPDGLNVFKIKTQINDDQLFNLHKQENCPKVTDLINEDSKNKLYDNILTEITTKHTKLHQEMQIALFTVYNTNNTGMFWTIDKTKDPYHWIKEAWMAAEFLRSKHFSVDEEKGILSNKNGAFEKAVETLNQTHDLLYLTQLGMNYSPALRLIASPLLLSVEDNIRRNLAEVVLDETTGKIRRTNGGVFYGAKIMNLVALEEIFFGIGIKVDPQNVTIDRPLPTFSSNYIFEVNTVGDSKVKIRVRKDGEYFKFCQESVSADNYGCEMESFFKQLRRRIDVDWRTTCGFAKKEPYKNPALFVIVYLLCAVFSLLALLVVCTIRFFFKSDVPEKKPRSRNGSTEHSSLDVFKPVATEEDFSLDKDLHSMVKVKRM